jgi:hypothetical protein
LNLLNDWPSLDDPVVQSLLDGHSVRVRLLVRFHCDPALHRPFRVQSSFQGPRGSSSSRREATCSWPPEVRQRFFRCRGAFFRRPFRAASAPPPPSLSTFATTGIEKSNTAFAAVNLNVRSGSRPPARSSVSLCAAFVAEPSPHFPQKNTARISLGTSSTFDGTSGTPLGLPSGSAESTRIRSPVNSFFRPPKFTPIPAKFPGFHPLLPTLLRHLPFRIPSKVYPQSVPPTTHPPPNPHSPHPPTLHTPSSSISFSASQVVDTRLVHAALLRSTHLISPARNPACSAGP